MKKKIALLLFLICIVCLLIFNPLQARKFIPKSDLLFTVIQYVKTYYVDPHRLKPEEMLAGSLENLSKHFPEVITNLKKEKDQLKINVKVDTTQKVFRASLKTIQDFEALLQEIIIFIKTHIENLEKPETIDYAAINGFLQKLDPHSDLLPPKIYNEFNTTTKGNFSGVGMTIGIREGKLTVISPIDGTPAARAGLQPQDHIIQINDESTINLSLDDAVKKLRGKKGTPVTIYIMRKGFSEPKKIKVFRDIIKITSVESHVFQKNHQRVGYLRIKTFQKNTMKELNQHLKEINYDFNDFKGLIIDLRNNPGGLLNQAIRVGDRFLDEGTIVATSGLDPATVKDFQANWYNTISICDTPIIVLINSGSASASEIVSAAIKGNQRGIILGEQTFGKGSVQQIFPMADGSALKMTTAKYLTPGKRSIQSVGVTPDVQIIPYVISKEYTHILPPKRKYSEESLQQTFREWSSKKEKPQDTFFYIYNPPADKKDKEKKAEYISAKNQMLKFLAKDFTTQLAQKILFNLPHSTKIICQENKRKTYEYLLQKSLKTVRQEERSQEIELIKQLKTRGINWNTSTSKIKDAKLLTKIWIEKEIKKQKKTTWQKLSTEQLTPGTKFRLYMAVTNQGKEKISRLYALTSSKNNIYDDHQFIFGQLLPHQTKQWFVTINIPERSYARNDVMKAQFFNAQTEKIYQKEFALITQEKPRPSFNYSIRLFDNGKNGSKGNADNIIQLNETIALELTILNSSQTSSGEIIALMTNQEGKAIFLKKGRNSIKKLPAQKSQKLYFTFDVKEIPDDHTFDMSLELFDNTYLLKSIEHKFKIKTAPPQSIILKNQPPTITLKNPSLISKKLDYRLKGNVNDDQQVKDFYAFKNNKKIFYQRYRKSQPNLKFSIPLTLDQGINEILLMARDNNNVISRKILYIRKPKL